jgi:cytochrome c5
MRNTIQTSLLCTSIAIALIAATKPKAKPVSLPKGAGQAQVKAACSNCHAMTIITNARKSRAQWEDSVDIMIDRGAPVSDANYDLVITYLSKNFKPR